MSAQGTSHNGRHAAGVPGNGAPTASAQGYSVPNAGAQGYSAPNAGVQGVAGAQGYAAAQGYGAQGVSGVPGYAAQGVAGQGMYVPMPPAPKKRGWIVALVFVILLFVWMTISTVSCMKFMGDSLNSSLGYGDISASQITTDTIAVIHLSGEIGYNGTECSPEGLKSLLDACEDNGHIKAIVLRVDSGGGTATAGEEMATYVKQCELPIVVSSASINATSAFEISSQADYFFVAKSTAIGSIGTAIEFVDLSGLYEKLGINFETITSADSKDSSYGNRSLTDEERAYYQNMITQINDTFIKTVAEGRHMDEAAVRQLASGLTFTGLDSITNGLADELGTLEDAIAKAAELAGISEYDTYDLSLPKDASIDMLSYLLGSTNADMGNTALRAKEFLHL